MKKPFQIGERVCATYPGGKYIGEVVKSNDEFTSILGEYGTGFYMFQTQFVRRLKRKPKKKAREWSLLLRKDGSYGTIHPANTKAGKIGKNYELVRVREVL